MSWSLNGGHLLTPAQAVDLLLATVLLAGTFALISHSRAAPAIRRTLIIGAVLMGGAAAAWLSGLVVFAGLLSVVLAAYAVAAVLALQSEIRLLVHRLGAWAHRQGLTPTDALVGVVTEAADRMAQRRVGALIAIRGADPWEPWTQGGVALHGVPSVPLLMSLFDASTPGHDGAVLLEQSRVTRFAVHLPLSALRPSIARFGGTRHAAALGLSEMCDAFVIAVSEERGTICVARDGRLTELPSAEALKAELAGFLGEGAPPTTEGGRRAVARSVGPVVLAGAIAGLLWMAVNSGGSVVRTLDVPVTYHDVPDRWALQSSVEDSVRVTLRGPERALDWLEQRRVGLEVDMSSPRLGSNQFAVTSERLDLPPAVTLIEAKPPMLDVHAKELEAHRVSVAPSLVGTLPGGGAPQLSIEPSEVALLTPRGEPPPSTVRTEPIDLATVSDEDEVERALIVPTDARLAEEETKHVRIRMRSPAAPTTDEPVGP